MEVNGDVKPLQRWGGSLPVENVQALAASKELTEIPQRYIRSDVVSDLHGTVDDEIPIVDLGRLQDLASFEAEATKLKFACEEWGFFQLINHGVANELVEQMKADIEEFYRLPLEEKKAYAQLPGSIEGYGHAFVVSEEQTLDWGDMFIIRTQPLSFRSMRFWPTHPSTFRDTLDKYSTALKNVAELLLGSMAKNLGLSPEEFTNLFGNGFQAVNMNYYPRCPHADKVLGLSPHSDSVALTLVLQVNQVEGLQIKRNAGWLPIKPIPGAFIVNVGDALEVLTNGRYKSIEHRVIVNPEKERMSIGAFHSPNCDALIGPLPKLVEGSECYKTLSHESYMRLNASAKLDGKNRLAQMKLK
ncbi:S-norcoclaurine synthase 1-like [Asparagus officinalis]|uniref:S-norcoclaurine synthase 1-like n=1 Tax=Asparagus officinalis TaxID=4686 RepID=UPI00098E7399|nr:S-norcoclaurine synthase 1-like [Asparagus officinalis]